MTEEHISQLGTSLEYSIAREELKSINEMFFQILISVIIANLGLGIMWALFLAQDFVSIFLKNSDGSLSVITTFFFAGLGVASINFIFIPLTEELILNESYWKQRISEIEAKTSMKVLSSAYARGVNSLEFKTKFWMRLITGVRGFWILVFVIVLGLVVLGSGEYY